MIDQAGQLDRRITIQKPVNAREYTTDAVDEFGQRVSTDSAVFEGESCVVDDINELGGIEGDPFGQIVVDYITHATVWARVIEKVGNEAENGDMISSTHRVDFFIRYRDDINAQMRIVYNNKTYKIHAIQSADAREAFQMIRCEYTDAE